jgi:hypothetical protein
MFVYLVGIGTFLVLSQELIFWVLPLWKHALIESLVGVPPIHVVKTAVTLEEVVENLSSLEKSLPNLLDNASQVNESIESIGKIITVLEASTIHDSQNLRIGKLEESMETLS